MLVLSRKQNETIQIGNDVSITVLKISGNTVRLGINAPIDVRVVRGELDIKMTEAENTRSADSINTGSPNVELPKSDSRESGVRELGSPDSLDSRDHRGMSLHVPASEMSSDGDQSVTLFGSQPGMPVRFEIVYVNGEREADTQSSDTKSSDTKSSDAKAKRRETKESGSPLSQRVRSVQQRSLEDRSSNLAAKAMNTKQAGAASNAGEYRVHHFRIDSPAAENRRGRESRVIDAK